MKKLCRKFGFSRWPRRSASIAEQEGADAEESDDQDQASQSSARPPNFADVLCGGGSSAGGKEEGQADEPGGPKRSDSDRGKGHKTFYPTGAAPYASHAVPHVPHATPEAYASTIARGGNSFVGFDPQAQLPNAPGQGQPTEMLQQLQIFQLLQLLQQQSGGAKPAPAAAAGSPSQGAISLLGGDMQMARASFPHDMASMPGALLPQRGGHTFSAGDISSSEMLLAGGGSSFSMPRPLQGQGMHSPLPLQGLPHGMQGAQLQGAQGLQPPQPPPGCSDVLEALKVGWLAGMQMAQSQQPSQAQVPHQPCHCSA